VKRTEQLIFPPFRLDLINEQLWRENELVPLRPKAFAMLRFLVEHAGRLLTKEELLKGVWPDTRVNEGILKGYIRDLRDILGDDSQHPRFIETVPRRGHRFIGQVASSQYSVASILPLPTQSSILSSQRSVLVGRDAELAQLDRLFAKALRGERQIVFVTGEPGIGKTTLVETFLQSLASENPDVSPLQTPDPRLQTLDFRLWIGRGQCVEQHGAGEAYLPVLEALGRIGRSPSGEQFVAILHQYAPTWLVQMPALLAAEELEPLQRRVVGATRERMLREMVEAIEALTTQRPLVLWLEDLHWADASTVDWLAAVARQGAPARLLVIGTYRPSDLSLSGHPLRAVKQELVAKGQCEELWLPFLSAKDVTHYLTRRCPDHQFPPGLGSTIHRRTDGNPLFVVNMVEYLAAQGVIAEVDGHWRLQTTVDEVGRGLPENLRQLIEKHIERLSEEHQRLLEVASVAGVTFSATAVAAGTDVSVEQVEEWCEGLVKRGQFLQAQEPHTLPDGTLCGSYGFQHALQQVVVYERIPNLRRLRLHRRMGDGEERSYGARAHEVAAELAVHFERGGDLPRAVQYRQHAGHNALRQHGYQEAITHFRRGLDLLETFPDTPERRQQELALQVALGSPLQALQGYGAPEVEAVYTRARELSQGIGETAQLFPVLRGLYVFYLLRGKIQTAHELGERLLSLAQSVQDSAFLLEAHFAVGQTLMFRGEFVAAREHLEQGIALYDPVRHHSHAFLYGQDPGVFCRLLAAWDLYLLGYPDQALKRNQEALTVAQEVIHPFSVAAAQAFFAVTHQFRREGQAAQEHAEAAVELSSQQGFPFFLAFGTILRGWARVEQGQTEEGIPQVRQGLAAYRATGAELATTRFVALLAEAWGKAGQPEEGLNVLAEALAVVNKGGERDYEVELYRLKGELTLQQASQKSKVKVQKSKIPNPKSQILDPQSEAEAYFLKALDIARQQQAKSLELRAVMSLVRLRQQQAMRASRNLQHVSRDRLDEAHKMLSEVYYWFTEGFETQDLQDAKALLDARA
jgi:DNA-binding winged helix-turn-helix (wHTH) protein/predicted ATPase